MPLPSSSQPLPRGGNPIKSSAPNSLSSQPASRPTAPKPQSAPAPKDTSIFGGRPSLTPHDIKNKWFMGGRDCARPDGRGFFSSKDRSEMLKGLEKFSQGSSVTPMHVDGYLEQLGREKSGKPFDEQAKIDQKIAWLRGQFKGPGK